MYYGDEIKEIIPFSAKFLGWFRKYTLIKIIVGLFVLSFLTTTLIIISSNQQKEEIVKLVKVVEDTQIEEIVGDKNIENVENIDLDSPREAVRIDGDKAVAYVKYTAIEDGQPVTKIKVIRFKKTEEDQWEFESIEDLNEENIDEEQLEDLCDNIENATQLEECQTIIDDDDDDWLRDPCTSDADCPNDGVFCNGAESCDEERGYCVHGDDPCQSAGLICNGTNNVCVVCRSDNNCPDDGIFCNGDEICDEGLCKSSQDRCLGEKEICSEENNQCIQLECFDNSECDDGNYCNGLESCVDNYCQAGTIPCLDDDLFCTGVESCDETTDGYNCVSAGDPCVPDLFCSESSDGCVTCLNDANCDDGLFCNGAESCVSGICQSGTSSCPDDRAFCNGEESCSESNDSCLSSGDPCLGQLEQCDETQDICLDLECNTDDDCSDDDQFCTGEPICDTNNNRCVNSPDPCPGEYCDESQDDCDQCTTDAQCIDDGIFCNGQEICTDGSCGQGSDPCPGLDCNETEQRCDWCSLDSDCDNGAFCDGAETCVGGQCQDGSQQCVGQLCDETDDICEDIACDDSDDCPNDFQFCNGEPICDTNNNICVNSPDPCPGQMCNETNDVCANCLDNTDCVDTIFCDGLETCNFVTGNCEPGSGPCPGQICDEGNNTCIECFVDADCPSDGDNCTIDSCQGNVCQYIDKCPGQACDASGQCVECTLDSDCSDSLDCTVNERCVDNICQSDNLDCSDSLICNGVEFCDESIGGCVSPGFLCSQPGFVCTEETECICDDDLDCDDGFWCNGVETCDGSGSCQDGSDSCTGGLSCLEDEDRCIDSCDIPGQTVDEQCQNIHTLWWRECTDQLEWTERTTTCASPDYGYASFNGEPERRGWTKITLVASDDTWIQYEKGNYYILLWSYSLARESMLYQIAQQDPIVFLISDVLQNLENNTSVDYTSSGDNQVLGTYGGTRSGYQAAYVVDNNNPSYYNKEIAFVDTSCSQNQCRNWGDTYVKILLWNIDGNIQGEIDQILDSLIIN